MSTPESNKRKPTLAQILADPKNRQVSAKFFRFTFLMLILPLGFMFASIKGNWFSIEHSAIIAVVLVNVVMVTYAIGAYREEVSDYTEATGPASDKKSKKVN